MSIQSFKELTVWQKSVLLAEKIYERTSEFPVEEKFGITAQMRRAAVSVPANIAEGYGRNNRKEFSHFIGISRGSAAELETQLYIAQKVYGLDFSDESELLTEIRKMLTVLSQKIRV